MDKIWKALQVCSTFFEAQQYIDQEGRLSVFFGGSFDLSTMSVQLLKCTYLGWR